MGTHEKVQGEKILICAYRFEISDSFWKAMCSYSLKYFTITESDLDLCKGLRFVPSNCES